MENTEAREVLQKIENKINDAIKGLVRESDLQNLKKELTEMQVVSTKSEVDKISDKFNELKEILEKQGLEIEGLTQRKYEVPESIEKIADDDILASEAYKEFCEDPRGTSRQLEFSSKAIHNKVVSIENNYTGSVLITQDSGRRVVNPDRPLNMRDIMTIERSGKTNFVYPKVTNFVWSVSMESENSELDESSFEVEETPVGAKRLGSIVDISKNMINNAPYVRSVIINRLAKRLRYREDVQILWGDGQGNNLDGLMKNARTFDLTPTSFSAGDILSVVSYKSGTQALITFASAHDLSNGYSITLANTSNYNSTYNIIVVSQTQIIIDATYVAEATAAWTGTVTHPAYQDVTTPNEADVLSVAASTLKTLWFTPTAIILNPLDSNKIKNLLKGTDSHYLLTNSVELRTGKLYINGLPVVETDAMPAGRFLIGDFNEATALVDYQTINIFFTTDVSYAKKNKVAIIAEEQVILPIYNSLFLMQGKFSDAITELTYSS